ncbi:hypothetical protein [Hyphomonas sp.]|uniref:hypothetical protein n=1 Tax=Hyphomonas sp. TaxID=87 RepID=UPI003F6FDC80
MPDVLVALNADIAAQPQWIQVWLNILIGVLGLSIPFSLVRVEARWILLGLVLGVAGVVFLYSLFGYSRLLGLGHVVAWTPLVIYLLARRSQWRVAETWSGKWILAALTVLIVSLAFDYLDVIRWGLGERA